MLLFLAQRYWPVCLPHTGSNQKTGCWPVSLLKREMNSPTDILQGFAKVVSFLSLKITGRSYFRSWVHTLVKPKLLRDSVSFFILKSLKLSLIEEPLSFTISFTLESKALLFVHFWRIPINNPIRDVLSNLSIYYSFYLWLINPHWYWECPFSGFMWLFADSFVLLLEGHEKYYIRITNKL